MRRLLASLGALALVGCATLPAATAGERFVAGLQPLCGKAFAGRIVSGDAVDAPMRGEPLVMHVRDCRPGETWIAFHVGNDRSRTWIVRRAGEGLELRHDHRHRDGGADTLTDYGGYARVGGTGSRQEFPADARTIALFTRTGRSVSNANVWALELGPRRFVYELRRPPGPGERFFRVEFDLSEALPEPPSPWGAPD